MSIIIVDDNETNLLIVEKILQKAGYHEIKKASSAKDLYAQIGLGDSKIPAEDNVDLILMDMMMPEIDGVEACLTIVAEERFRDVPIIFVTALGDSNKMAEALDAGATDYVMKPINKVELLARIRSALRLKHEKDWHRERDKRIRFELDLARQVQRSVLSEPVRGERIAIDAVYLPSSELAGDFYAWYPLGGSKYGIMLFDVMGHGISSSLVCMYIYSALQDAIKRNPEPVRLMKELNRRMVQLHIKDQLMNYYFTAIYLVIDTEQKTMEYVNAGHPEGLLYKDGELVPLTDGCCAIGLFDQIEISKGFIRYEDKAQIVLYTDGLLECLKEEGAAGIDGRLKSLPGEYASVAERMDALLRSGHDEGAVQEDDICFVVVETH